MRTLTLTQLKAAGACPSAIARFEQLFGDQVGITKALCVKHASDFNFGWAARHLLGDAAREKYNKTCATAMAEYNKACAPAWAEYDKALAAAWAEYDKASAAAFGRCYSEDGV